MRFLFIAASVLISGCGNYGEVQGLLDKCSDVYKEPCVFVPVPESKEDDMRQMYNDWRK